MAQILVFGDSITDGSTDSRGGWADRLKQFFWAQNIKNGFDSEYHWVYNLGISGDMTADVLKRIEVESIAREVTNKNRNVIFVFAVGINDSRLKGKNSPKSEVKDNEFEENYQQLIHFAKKYTDMIICVGITCVDESRTSPIYDEYWYKNERIQEFNRIIKLLAVKNGVKFVELFDKFLRQNEYQKKLDDGLHPNDEGHEWMYEQIKPVVLKVLEK